MSQAINSWTPIITSNNVKINVHHSDRKLDSIKGLKVKSIRTNEILIKKWNYLISNISFKHNDDYYYSLLPLQPKFSFYISLNDSDYPLQKLKLFLPETLISSGAINLYYYGNI